MLSVQHGPIFSGASLNSGSTVGWGVVGMGHIVVDNLASAIIASSGSRLLACAGRDPQKTAAVAKQFGNVRTYRNHEELANDPDVEVVYVATPNAFHKAAVIAAARARKHVLCEKPLALSVDDARARSDACREAGGILRVAF